ncbi:hypothetical protein SmJEL517_g05336 [Synchytrium microbalum]|uniref:EF-hand domain-containing protein n=1 Tax=Synchytrium microbalum TaxID=1806994 RepID=A0A507BUU8_9FUNG|nr:uncharacterized protein SmJEL517_g05336 [Synchytrium microbalum]TPX31312.1 hypothetical protein SmJEL517_g05336 [Synchytrium microbalum]
MIPRSAISSLPRIASSKLLHPAHTARRNSRGFSTCKTTKTRQRIHFWILGTTFTLGIAIITPSSANIVSSEGFIATDELKQKSASKDSVLKAISVTEPAVNSQQAKPVDTANLENCAVYEYPDGNSDKPRLLILGSGWAATSLIKSITPGMYQILVLSPTNYFLFTPLLPEATTGTVEARSLMESMRAICLKKEAHYLEATAQDIDIERKQVIAQGRDGKPFRVPYDLCVVSVGATNQTFGVPGVNENALFLKTIADARKIRYQIGSNLEAAALPSVTDAEKRRLLSIVIAGGGPTGTEFAAEISDFVSSDVRRLFPELIDYVTITVVQAADHILNTMAAKLSAFAEYRFKRQNINLLTKTRVVAVEPSALVYKKREADPKAEPEKLPFGICVWATGIGMRDFTRKLHEKIQEQTHSKSLVVDNRLRILGADCLYAMGDCATIENPALLKLVMEHIRRTGQDKLTYEQFGHIAAHMIREYPAAAVHLERLGDLFTEYDFDKSGTLDVQEITAMLTEVDKQLTSLPQTAQVASQEGLYLAKTLNKLAAMPQSNIKNKTEEWRSAENTLAPFRYSHFGTFSYVGGETAVLDLEGGWGTGGLSVFWLWRGAYLSRQVSFRTRALLGLDWIKTAIFGRDVSRS